MMTSDVIERIFGVFDRFGAEYYGEEIPQLQHGLQAAELARLAGASDTLIVAALLHDIGQFLDDAGHAAERKGVDAHHEVHGAAMLAQHFPPALTEPVRLHVQAKRYLCHADPAYLDGLSHASVLSLSYQGGPMDAAEAAAFEQAPYFADALVLRRADDGGKRIDWAVPDLESYRPLIAAQLVRPE
jgi:phosphonate degradation associated HDIG domain protein